MHRAFGVAYDEQLAAQAVRRAAAGLATPSDAKILLDLFTKATKRGMNETQRASRGCVRACRLIDGALLESDEIIDVEPVRL